jgi:hypothetical protein
MRISSLISILQQAQTEHGNLEVGFCDYEGRFCRMVRSANIRHHWSSEDDKKLGEKFVALEDQVIG